MRFLHRTEVYLPTFLLALLCLGLVACGGGGGGGGSSGGTNYGGTQPPALTDQLYTDMSTGNSGNIDVSLPSDNTVTFWFYWRDAYQERVTDYRFKAYFHAEEEVLQWYAWDPMEIGASTWGVIDVSEERNFSLPLYVCVSEPDSLDGALVHKSTVARPPTGSLVQTMPIEALGAVILEDPDVEVVLVLDADDLSLGSSVDVFRSALDEVVYALPEGSAGTTLKVPTGASAQMGLSSTVPDDESLAMGIQTFGDTLSAAVQDSWVDITQSVRKGVKKIFSLLDGLSIGGGDEITENPDILLHPYQTMAFDPNDGARFRVAFQVTFGPGARQPSRIRVKFGDGVELTSYDPDVDEGKLFYHSYYPGEYQPVMEVYYGDLFPGDRVTCGTLTLMVPDAINFRAWLRNAKRDIRDGDDFSAESTLSSIINYYHAQPQEMDESVFLEALFTRGRALRNLGDFDGAGDDYSEIVTRSWSSETSSFFMDANDYEYRARKYAVSCYVEAGESDAAEDLLDAIIIHPSVDDEAKKWAVRQLDLLNGRRPDLVAIDLDQNGNPTRLTDGYRVRLTAYVGNAGDSDAPVACKCEAFLAYSGEPSANLTRSLGTFWLDPQDASGQFDVVTGQQSFTVEVPDGFGRYIHVQLDSRDMYTEDSEQNNSVSMLFDPGGGSSTDPTTFDDPADIAQQKWRVTSSDMPGRVLQLGLAVSGVDGSPLLSLATEYTEDGNGNLTLTLAQWSSTDWSFTSGSQFLSVRLAGRFTNIAGVCRGDNDDFQVAGTMTGGKSTIYRLVPWPD